MGEESERPETRDEPDAHERSDFELGSSFGQPGDQPRGPLVDTGSATGAPGASGTDVSDFRVAETEERAGASEEDE